MKHILKMIFMLAIICICTDLSAAAFYADPAVKDGGDGTKKNPWPHLGKCIKNGNLNKLKPGDTLVLREGYHGWAYISGINKDCITIEGEGGKDVRISRLVMTDVDQWKVKGLRISPTFGKPYEGPIIEISEKGKKSGKVIIEDCEIFGFDEHKDKSGKDWITVNHGVCIGRHSKGNEVRNCYIRNVRHALVLNGPKARAEGNVIENYSADAMRMTRDGQVARHNIIKNAFGTEKQWDYNHDDAIQCFLFNKGKGIVRNITISHNIIIGQSPGSQPNASYNQGLGLFDGPLVNFHIEGNVISVDHWHGVAVYDGQNCSILDNVVWNEHGGDKKRWVKLGSKRKQAKNNIVKNNHAYSFNLKQPGTKSENNKKVTKEIYNKSLEELSEVQMSLYGSYHRVAKRHRITGVYKQKLKTSDYAVQNEK